jgi:hypothetical protein
MDVLHKLPSSQINLYCLSDGELFQPHLKYTLKFFQTCTLRSRSFITTLFHSSVHFIFELSIEKIIKYSRQAAYSQSMGLTINISHAQ